MFDDFDPDIDEAFNLTILRSANNWLREYYKSLMKGENPKIKSLTLVGIDIIYQINENENVSTMNIPVDIREV